MKPPRSDASPTDPDLSFIPPIPTFAERVAIIKVSQQADPILSPIIENLHKGNLVSPYVLKQGVLIRKQGLKIMILDSLIGDVLDYHHKGFGMHVAAFKMMAMIKENLLWHSISKDVKAYTKACVHLSLIHI